MSCDIYVVNRWAVQTASMASVFHVQRVMSSMKSQYVPSNKVQTLRFLSNKRAQASCLLLLSSVLGVLPLFTANSYAQEKECIDFYAVGESKCDPAPKAQPEASGAPQLIVPAAEKTEQQKVDEYLENYGKPPREFVEFYMNPTPENAKKWVKAYQGALQKSQSLSQMWEDAERLYGQQGAAPALRRPTVTVPATTSQPGASTSSQPALPSAQLSQQGNFGAFNGVAPVVPANGVLPQDRGLKLTYYFSQTCPFCARMTPELSILTSKYSGKLEFTCVDVTPFSGAAAPNPAYLRDKLACQWRLPEGDELQREGVTQTPTLLVQPGGKPQVKLSGYMSQEQLQPYFTR